MKKTLFTLFTAGLIAGAHAQDEVKTGDEKGADIAAVAAEEAAKPKDVVALLKDQLIVADGEKVKDAALEEGMEYYLVYHSASW